MSVGRLRRGELLSALGAVALLVTLVLPWFRVEIRGSNQGFTAYAPLELPDRGLDQLGWLVVAACVAAIVLCLVMLALTASGSTGPAVMATVMTATVASIALALVALRLLIDQPSLGADLPGSAVAIQPAAWVGLIGVAALCAGAWLAIADERLDAPESVVVPPPARPAPPAGEPA